jgi:hypothetical protein
LGNTAAVPNGIEVLANVSPSVLDENDAENTPL